MTDLQPFKLIVLVHERDFQAIVNHRKSYVTLPKNDDSVVCSMLDISIVEIDDDRKQTGDYVDGLVSWVEFVCGVRVVSFETRKISVGENRPGCPYYQEPQKTDDSDSANRHIVKVYQP